MQAPEDGLCGRVGLNREILGWEDLFLFLPLLVARIPLTWAHLSSLKRSMLSVTVSSLVSSHYSWYMA